MNFIPFTPITATAFHENAAVSSLLLLASIKSKDNILEIFI